ncbi:MAG TPA: tetratricopeptide repeat protein, partial [Rhizomicrobium sp.]|nr:tetratricopeptide repeat protein [Rhizomicrobium sp.]
LIAPVVAANPQNALALANLGNVLNTLDRLEEALSAYNRSLAINPDYPPAWCNRANVLQELERLPEALASYDRALSVQPDFLPALNNRGNVLLKLGRCEEALGSYDHALALNPGYAEAHANRGDVLQRLCCYDEALAAYERALTIAPDAALTWNSRGVALVQLCRLDEARQSYARAAQLAPGMPEILLNQGLLHLLQQNFAKGWPLFEARKEMRDLGEARGFAQPLWTGAQDINGKTLFVYIRRGLGDAIHFYRYAALAQARGARVVLSVNDPLLPLLQSAVPAVPMIGLGQVPESFDYHTSLMSMPLALGTDIPKTGRYLAAEPARAREWRERIGGEGYRIGVAWQGDAVTIGAEGKSFPLAALARIAAIPGVRLISLQKNAGAEQLGKLPSGMAIESFPGFDDGPGAFLDSAAIMENCDLVISCDTAAAHLAGALGVPCWIALKHVPEWRWFLGRNDSPWYPSLRLFRQPATGDWAAVFRAMEAELISCPNR